MKTLICSLLLCCVGCTATKSSVVVYVEARYRPEHLDDATTGVVRAEYRIEAVEQPLKR